ncbi:MAG: aminotransferase class III-fold pyridoxal phosphate-dependent enzyme [Candidatus Dormibacteria bacterium]
MITRWVLEQLAAPAPELSLQAVEAVSADHFGVVGQATRLFSERDQNFRITARDGGEFVLKVSNQADGREVLHLQSEAMRHSALVDPDLPLMRSVLATGGSPDVEVVGAADEFHLVRMFTFMPGRHLEIDELRLDALRELGTSAARVARSLRGFFHPAAARPLVWNARHISELRPLLGEIEDAPHRELVGMALDDFAVRAEPGFAGLRAQVIHNDLSLSNLRFDEQQRVSGILDFGDVAHSALVCELVICAESVLARRDGMAALGAVVAGFESVTPLEEAESELLPDFLLARWAALALISSWRLRQFPASAAHVGAWQRGLWTMFEQVAELGLEEWRGLVQGVIRGGGRQGRSQSMPASVESLAERRRRLFGATLSPLFYDPPLHLVRGRGVWLYDASGRRYLDAYNNVPVVGHGHPQVVAAIARQSAILATNTRYLHGAPLELAERLVATMPDGLNTVLFVNSGSEANDLAWRLARSFTGGTGGVVTRFAYHGISAATADLSPEEWHTEARPAHVETVPAPDGYRGPYRREDADWVRRYQAHIDGAVSALAARGHRPAALFIDTGLTSEGILTPPPDYLMEVARRWRAAGGLLVGDEVQLGFGRSGSHMWGFESHGVVPDIVTLGKPMGNGYPIAAVVTRSEIVDKFAAETGWFSTFGGNQVACEAGLAVLDVIEAEGLLQRASAVGSALLGQLAELQARHPVIGEVRSLGLLVGVELVRERATREPLAAAGVANSMRDLGVLVGATGPAGNVIKIRPPLVITVEQASMVTDALDRVLAGLPDA